MSVGGRDYGCPPHEEIPDPNDPDECLVCRDYLAESDRLDDDPEVDWRDVPYRANAAICKRWPEPIRRLAERVSRV